MSRGDEAEFLRRIMETEGEAVRRNTTTVNQVSSYTVNRFDRYEELRREARGIKEDAVERLPGLIEEVREKVESNGGHVYLAGDSEDANTYIEEVVRGVDADSVVKSKSMTSEEIEVNDALERAGVDVWETDLGEFVIQVADETPSHLIGPAIHRSPESIAELFNRHFDLEELLTDDPRELTGFARDYVGDRILEADVGLTGANFVVADTGSIALVTNEGNARKTAVTPPVHVVVAGVEKIVPELTDLQAFMELIAKTGTGQDITSYVSLLTPPVDTPTVDFGEDEFGGDEREFHLVLLDNGRLEMRDDRDLRETLYCIRCGACANSCANFQSVGGHAFGGETYTGGIGSGWEAGVHGLDSAAEFNDLCTGCTRCVPKCPVKIDIPWINTVVRSRVNDADHVYDGLVPDDDGGDLQKRFFGYADVLARLGGMAPRLTNAFLGSGAATWLLGWVFGVDRRRPLPRFAGESFLDWFEAREDSGGSHEVVLYPDVYTNYFDVERGKAAVRVMEALDCSVIVPSVGDSGRAALSQGLLGKAKRHAEDVYDSLLRHVEEGRDVVVVEPSDYAMFVSDYSRLLQDSSHLARNTYEVMNYVAELLPDDLDGDAEGEVFYHSHCQQQTLGMEEPTVELLERLGYSVSTSGVECCGMAGSFGYKSDYYEVSVDVGEQLVEEVPDGVVAASGTSCREQLEHLTGSDVRHPVELVAEVRGSF